MPIPIVLAVASAAAGLIGVGGHLSAKETNERAQALANKAQNIFNTAKESLERAQKKTETSLLTLGYSKKNVLETSIYQFLQAYERIKMIKLKESPGLNEIKNFTIENKDALELWKMSDIYENAFAGGTAAGVTGAVVALAASGTLPIVTGTLSIAGSALTLGEIGVAAELAGSALSLGAAMTPLAAVAAPAVLVTGISSSMKADENLEKAQAMCSEAEAAAEEMRISETLCNAITEKAELFNNLLNELNGMFSDCVHLLDGVTRSKTGLFKGKTVKSSDLTDEEMNLIAVTKALAHAVKSILDTPIINNDGTISNQAQEIYDSSVKQLPILERQVKEVKQYNYAVKKLPKNTSYAKRTQKDSSVFLDSVRSVFSLAAAVFASYFAYTRITGSLLICAFVFTVSAQFLLNDRTKIKFFTLVNKFVDFSFLAECGILFFLNCRQMVDMNHFLIADIVCGFILVILMGLSLASDNMVKHFKLRKIIGQVISSAFLFAAALLLFALLYKLIDFPFAISVVITEILYILFIWAILANDYNSKTQNKENVD